ncbi:hypothetical protein ACVWWK_003247 [Bradyrhizobium sp. LB9.1b]
MMPAIQHMRFTRQRLAMTLSVATLSVVMAAPAHASGSSMPWEQPLQQILQSIEGASVKPDSSMRLVPITRARRNCMPSLTSRVVVPSISAVKAASGVRVLAPMAPAFAA